MSKRFGRNQRRRAREAIATLERLASSARESWAQEHRRADAYQAIIDGIRDALGPESVVLDAPMRGALAYFQPQIQTSQPEPAALEPDDHRLLQPDDHRLLQPDDHRLLQLHIHTHDVITTGIAHDHAARRTHFRVKFKDRDVVGYAFDPIMLERRELHQRLHLEVARTCADELLRLIRGGKLR